MRVPGAKWTEAEIADVLARRARGETYPSIAASYGVQDSTIRKAVKRYGGGSPGQSRVVEEWSPPERANPFPWVEGGHVEPLHATRNTGDAGNPGPFWGAPGMRPVPRGEAFTDREPVGTANSGSRACQSAPQGTPEVRASAQSGKPYSSTTTCGASNGPVDGGRASLYLRIADLCRRGPQTLEALCDALDLPPSKTRKAVADAQAAGYTIAMAGDSYALQSPDIADSHEGSAAVSPVTGDRYLLGVCSDLHFGSKYTMRKQLADYVDAAYAQGVRTMVCAGDILDGCYRHGVWELSHHGWDEQAQDAFESLPQRPGLSWHFCDGNHDQTFWDQSGAVSGLRLVDYFRGRGRDDLHFLGAREGNLAIACQGVKRPVRVQLWHPKPNKAYALSYQLQKRIEAYAPGTKPDVLIAGHWHCAVYLATRGVHALAAGCFQSPESAFSRSLTGGVSCGGWVLEWQLTKDGTMREVGSRWRAYYHHEEARALELAAS